MPDLLTQQVMKRQQPAKPSPVEQNRALFAQLLARPLAAPPQMPPALMELGASMIPFVGDAMSAGDARRAGQSMSERLRAGDYGGAASSGLEAVGHWLGALPMIPSIVRYHGSSQGPIDAIRERGKFNTFGREGFYTTPHKDLAAEYARGAEHRLQRTDVAPTNPHVVEVDVEPQSVLDGFKPLGKDGLERLKAAIRSDPSYSSMSDIGRKTLDRRLDEATGDQSLYGLSQSGIDIASFLGRAARKMGYDAITLSEGKEMIILDPARARILSQEAVQ